MAGRSGVNSAVTFAPAFPVPSLPATAFRRSWLAEALVNRAAGEQFLALLKRLNPDRARRVGAGRPLQALEAVLAELPFPTESDYVADQVRFGEMSLEDVWHWGIPIDVQGYHPDHPSAALQLASVTCGYYDGLAYCYTLEYAHLLAWVKTWWRPAAALPPVKPPRGREFVSPWHALPELQRYVRQTIGNDWLDLNFEDIDGSMNPRWNAAEIRSLTRMWRQAQPIEARIHALADFVDHEPRERLPILDRALRGDRETLEQITRRKAQPLWKSFSRMHR